MDTQKLLILAFITSFLLGAANSIYQNDAYTSSSAFSSIQDISGDYEEQITSDSSYWGSVRKAADSLTDNTIGNTLKMGYEALKVLLDGINPLSITPSQFDLEIEKTIVYILITIRGAIFLLLGLEAYLVFKNQKAT